MCSRNPEVSITTLRRVSLQLLRCKSLQSILTGYFLFKKMLFLIAAAFLVFGHGGLAANDSAGVKPSLHCHDNDLLRCLLRSSSVAIPYCSSVMGIYPTPSTTTIVVTSELTL